MNLGLIIIADMMEMMERLTYHLRDVAAQLPDDAQWKPIETAPKDGTIIDLWDDMYKCRVTGARWAHHRCENGKPIGEKSWGRNSIDGPFVGIPTHWMPLPKPPGDTK